jgi:hypothetical protein
MRIVPTLAGVALGTIVAPRVMDMIGVPATDGVGMDDLVQAAIITAAIMLVNKVLPG